ncbi:PRC-barrel domain-containing protein [Sulfitobacter sp. D35]|uniref:PRC-barrel domain-containing protein n=1 Tax=Sulfitobacter sp. D35 TaxID=3083252 RepID=UPI00296E6186|nr:PRC-barrel domain-containing protein [Sulfitobacter sp. D35]MDW4499907.1 PRC-barrel domain-containing protein [Sulfitobacter sp. D35]
MKNLLLTTAIVAASATAGLAQSDAASPFATEAGENAVRASDFIGMRVYASETEVSDGAMEGVQADWEDIGEINDVILSREGEVQSVLVDIGGFLGIGERQVAIDMDAVRFVSDDATDADDYFLVLTADKAMLEGAPEYTENRDMAAAQVSSEQATGATQTDEATTETAEADAEQPIGEAVTEETAEATQDAEQATENAMEETAEAAEGAEQTTENALEETAEATEEVEQATETAAADAENAMEEIAAEADVAEGEPVVAEGDMQTAMAHDGYSPASADVISAETLTGARVYDANDEWIGEVSMFLLGEGDADNQAVVDVGGFLGIGEKPVALNIEELDILQADDGDDVRVYVSMTKDQLEAMPTFEK